MPFSEPLDHERLTDLEASSPYVDRYGVDSGTSTGPNKINWHVAANSERAECRNPSIIRKCGDIRDGLNEIIVLDSSQVSRTTMNNLLDMHTLGKRTVLINCFRHHNTNERGEWPDFVNKSNQTLAGMILVMKPYLVVLLVNAARLTYGNSQTVFGVLPEDATLFKGIMAILTLDMGRFGTRIIQVILHLAEDDGVGTVRADNLTLGAHKLVRRTLGNLDTSLTPFARDGTLVAALLVQTALVDAHIDITIDTVLATLGAHLTMSGNGDGGEGHFAVIASLGTTRASLFVSFEVLDDKAPKAEVTVATAEGTRFGMVLRLA